MEIHKSMPWRQRWYICLMVYLVAMGVIATGTSTAGTAAEQLAAAWLGVSQLKQSLGVSGPPSSAEIAIRVRRATETMLRGWAAGGNSR